MGRMRFSLARHRQTLASLALLFMVGPAVAPGVAVARTAGHREIAATAALHATRTRQWAGSIARGSVPSSAAGEHSKDVRFASFGWQVQTVAGPNPVLDGYIPG